MEQAEALDNLEYLGWVSREQVVAALDSGDMLVLPSSIESFGTVALEAMARRRLVLVSPQCGIADWPDCAGGIIQMHAGETLPDAIERVRTMDEAERREIAYTACSTARTLSEHAVQQWLDICAALASGITPT